MLVNDSELAENTQLQDAKAAPDVQNNQRQPMYIPNSYTKQPQSWRAPQKRQKVVSIGVAAALVVVVLGVLAAVVPTTQGNASTGFGGLFQPAVNSVGVHQDKPALIAAQAATATAVTQDGYDAGNQSYAGVQSNFTLPNGTNTSSIPTGPANITTGGGISSTSTGTLNTGFYDPFSPGQCTYWADYEYHRLTGKTVTWSGNADTWAYGAQAAGWHVSSTPHLYSIIVLQGGVQNAGYGTGHVGVVEGINSDGSVMTTNWNIVGWGVYSTRTYYPGPGVSFIW